MTDSPTVLAEGGNSLIDKAIAMVSKLVPSDEAVFLTDEALSPAFVSAANILQAVDFSTNRRRLLTVSSEQRSRVMLVIDSIGFQMLLKV